jgi:SAM-dependent methyltransferase
MKRELLEILRCPTTGARLRLVAGTVVDSEIQDGELVSESGGHRYRIENSIPRFVPEQTYADSFGLQWNRFRRTQLDSSSGVPISRDRFYRFTGWHPSELDGKWVLDVGCGAGRFAEVALGAGANVVALDYSGAVDACWANLCAHPRLHVVQGDIYKLPFEPGRFDFVYCLGVLQHTPDVHAAFRAIPPQLRPGGRLAVDLYPRLWRNALWSKYWLRPLTKRLDPKLLFRAVQALVPGLMRASDLVRRIPVVGRKLIYAIPVVNYRGVYALSEQQLREWAVLDTFDMLAPAHDHPQTRATLATWLREAALEEVWVDRIGFLVGRGQRPARTAGAGPLSQTENHVGHR